MVLGLHERMVGLGPDVIGSKDRTIWTMMNIKSRLFLCFKVFFFKLNFFISFFTLN